MILKVGQTDFLKLHQITSDKTLSDECSERKSKRIRNIKENANSIREINNETKKQKNNSKENYEQQKINKISGDPEISWKRNYQTSEILDKGSYQISLEIINNKNPAILKKKCFQTFSIDGEGSIQASP